MKITLCKLTNICTFMGKICNLIMLIQEKKEQDFDRGWKVVIPENIVYDGRCARPVNISRVANLAQ